MKNHLVSDSNCNVVIYNPPKDLQGMTKDVGFTFVLLTLNRGLQLVLSKTIRIGDTKYHIKIVTHHPPLMSTPVRLTASIPTCFGMVYSNVSPVYRWRMDVDDNLSHIDIPTKYQQLIGITILLLTGRFLNSVINVDYWYWVSIWVSTIVNHIDMTRYEGSCMICRPYWCPEPKYHQIPISYWYQ
jgi:hypothetical protein